ncbi:hypothetical protein D3C74_417750 [compost metagenome]
MLIPIIDPVARKMLGASGDSIILHPPHHSSGQTQSAPGLVAQTAGRDYRIHPVQQQIRPRRQRPGEPGRPALDRRIFAVFVSQRFIIGCGESEQRRECRQAFNR